ncbi:hypothetical protein CMV_015736 [Castanea mollissima]|uniref:Uncharacterized protein n=1 Tax=Castanea mollissima TaxID=60419 RepID=A0A8J4R9J0_9ROSI|nr:hypothetical protein CMV_015736 [Castanea mollissima]
MEHQQLNDLLYLHYNYRLKDSINKTEFWVVEEEEPPLLDYVELENTLYEEGAYPIEERSSSYAQGDMNNDMIEDDFIFFFFEDDDIDLGSFGVKMILLDLKIEIILMKMKMKMKLKMKMKMKMMRMRIMMMAVVEHLDHMMTLISNIFITNETCVDIQ